jgi:DNA-binding MarR family transcriptional regulator
MSPRPREVSGLDPVVHAPIRLAALSLLSSAAEAEFTYLRDCIGTTDGNLSMHLSKLEAAGYVTVKKDFVGRKPRTRYRITGKGRAAFFRYLASLKALLKHDLDRGG